MQLNDIPIMFVICAGHEAQEREEKFTKVKSDILSHERNSQYDPELNLISVQCSN